MDSLKTLYENGQYGLIVDLTKGSEDGESLFYLIGALLALNKGREALDVITLNKDALWAFKPDLLIKYDFEVLFLLNEFDKAYEDMAWFQNQPYVSQSVEEKLKTLPSMIRAAEKASFASKDELDDEKVKDLLITEKDDYKVLVLMDYVKSNGPGNFVPQLRSIVSSKRHDNVRTYALLLLLVAKDDEPIEFAKMGETHHVVPSKLNPPFMGEAFETLKKCLLAFTKDTSLVSTANEILGSYQMAIYPHDALAGDVRLLSAGLLKAAMEYLSDKSDLSELATKSGHSVDEITAKSREILDILARTEPLVY